MKTIRIKSKLTLTEDPEKVQRSIKVITRVEPYIFERYNDKKDQSPYAILNKILLHFLGKKLLKDSCHKVTAENLKKFPKDNYIRMIGFGNKVYHSYIVDPSGNIVSKEGKWPTQYSQLDSLWEMSIGELLSTQKQVIYNLENKR